MPRAILVTGLALVVLVSRPLVGGSASDAPYLVRDFDSPVRESGSSPRSLTALGDRLFFVAVEGHLHEQIWSSDGTEIGTSPLTNIPTVEGALPLTTVSSVGGM